MINLWQKIESFSLCKICNKRLRFEAQGRRRKKKEEAAEEEQVEEEPALQLIACHLASESCVRVLISLSRQPTFETHFSAEAGPWQKFVHIL